MQQSAIVFDLTRQEQNDVVEYFFPYMRLRCVSELNNLAHLDRYSPGYLGAVVIQDTFADVDRYMQKRRLEVSGITIRNKLPRPNAIVLLLLIMGVPLNTDREVYLVWLRTKIITLITKQIDL